MKQRMLLLPVAAVALSLPAFAACSGDVTAPSSSAAAPTSSAPASSAPESTAPTPSSTPSSSASAAASSASKSASKSASASVSVRSARASASSSGASGAAKATGTGYTFVAPEGWGKITPPSGSDLAYRSNTPRNGFSSNIVVQTKSDAGYSSAGAFRDAGRKELESDSAYANMKTRSATLGGTSAEQLMFEHTYQGSLLRQTQTYALHDGKAYLITISTDGGASEDELSSLTDSILDTWAWA